MTQFTTCLACACGAKYERAEVRLPIKDIGLFECHACGVVLEHWHGWVVPIFRPMQAKGSKSASAA